MPLRRTYIYNHSDTTVYAKVCKKTIESINLKFGLGVAVAGAHVGVAWRKTLMESGFTRIPAGERTDFQFSGGLVGGFDVYISIFMRQGDTYHQVADNLRKRAGQEVVVKANGAIRNLDTVYMEWT